MTDFRAQLNQAVYAIKNKEYARARKILKTVLNSEPGIVEAWLLYARVAPDKEQAKQSLEWALKLDPTNPLGLKMMEQLRASNSQEPQTQPRSSPPVTEEEAGNELEYREPEKGPNEDDSQLSKSQASPGRNRLSLTWIAVIVIICLIGAGALMLVQNPTEISRLLVPVATPTSDELFTIINQNIRAANDEDIQGYMETIHTRSPLRSQTEEALETAFSTYDRSYALSGLQIEEVNGEEARVSFTLTTRKVSGPAFRDNTIEGVFILRPDKGTWKIYQQEVLDVIYLN